MDSMTQLCESLQQNIRSKVSSTIYNLWYVDLKIQSLSETAAVFSINSDFKKDIIEKKHLEFISECISEILGFEVSCSIVSTQAENGFKLPDLYSNDSDYTQEEEKKPLAPVYNYDDEAKIDKASAIESHMIVEEYTFDNFIVGDSNKFAHAACTAVATQLSPQYNPLFIWGQSGLGKTHLLYAVTNEIKNSLAS